MPAGNYAAEERENADTDDNADVAGRSCRLVTMRLIKETDADADFAGSSWKKEAENVNADADVDDNAYIAGISWQKKLEMMMLMLMLQVAADKISWNFLW